jgi:hypothetical protein
MTWPARASAALAAGMNDNIIKPVNVSDLRAALRRWC